MQFLIVSVIFAIIAYLNITFNDAQVTKHIVTGVLGLLYGSYIILIYVIK